MKQGAFEHMINENGPVRSLGGRSLRLMHAAVEDAGRYTCIVSNSAGEERKNFDIDVLGKDNQENILTAQANIF